MSKIFEVIKNPIRLLIALESRGYIKILGDEKYLKILYKERLGKELNLENPKTFNEKLQWLKLNDRKDIYNKMVDKYEVRDYIKEKIGEEYLIPLYGVYEKFDEIDFDKLPNQFVLKTTHDSGGVIICKDKNNFNIGDARKKINKYLKKNFYYCGREWPYKNVKPRILCEKYMIDEKNHNNIIDYKFMCFNGKVKFLYTCVGRDSKEGVKINFFDINWEKMNLNNKLSLKIDNNRIVKKPKKFDTMLELAEILSKDNIFLRVDFYEINEKIYFGELTFYPWCGFESFYPEEYDKVLGDWIDLSSLKN